MKKIISISTGLKYDSKKKKKKTSERDGDLREKGLEEDEGRRFVEKGKPEGERENTAQKGGRSIYVAKRKVKGGAAGRRGWKRGKKESRSRFWRAAEY